MYPLPCTPLSILAVQSQQYLDKTTLYLGKWEQRGLRTQQGLGEPLWPLCALARVYV